MEQSKDASFTLLYVLKILPVSMSIFCTDGFLLATVFGFWYFSP